MNDLMNKARLSNTNLSLEELTTRIGKATSSLREKQWENVSHDNACIQQDGGGKYKRSRLFDIFQEFKREQATLIRLGSQGGNIPEQTRHVHVRTALASIIHGKCHSLGVRTKDVSVEALDKQIFDRYVDTLQSRQWNTISLRHPMQFPEPGETARTVNFITTMTPASGLDSVLRRKYQEDGINGICSYATQEKRHAVNLWRTEFRAEQPAGTQTKHGFSAIRHGVHDAYGIEDPRQRATANDARVKEFIHASLIDHLKRNKITLDDTEAGRPLSIDIVSVNLLTPIGKEKEMIKQQQQALSRASGREIQVQVSDEGNSHTVHVKPRIIMFNVPVDHLSLAATGNVMGIWRHADLINNDAIKLLIGSVEKNKTIGGATGVRIQTLNAELATITGNNTTDLSKRRTICEKITLIEHLTEQIRDIYISKLHHRVGNEPYKLPTRLLALANEIGATPAFNCKSGKDRTGQLNVEIRELYAQLIANGGTPRAVDAKREGLAKENYKILFMNGGDRDIQALNTGVTGSKTQLRYYHRLMDVPPKNIDQIKGLSKWVGA
ncbi:MAG: hypothetical protein KJ798_04040 [Gammaproteobacteria bacterium]|nr:hypothetical protein [Gammaproteobacteria bacterium]MBU0849443.1 hypothetical protein [Gammaproteobacteria bacterium]MBU1268142.1 hypothetical protein [Gammaproteobacteria bacterium]MBU1528906.1 hypothetical protein [Gammaproteobacteria bacterium]MBU1779536.1 hypothetical protein [Gammaproteobacteria bacterium]